MWKGRSSWRLAFIYGLFGVHDGKLPVGLFPATTKLLQYYVCCHSFFFAVSLSRCVWIDHHWLSLRASDDRSKRNSN
jgi:hypothetical protein